MRTSDFDLIVIGGGPAGTSGALTAASVGKRVVIVERSGILGGAGINTGTIPSKTLRESALLLSGARRRKLLGVSVDRIEHATLADFVHHERYVTSSSRAELERRIGALGVVVVSGSARFEGPTSVLVRAPDGVEERLCAPRILIATGSAPVRPPEFPFDHPRIHDSDEILEIVAMPTSLAVIGAGVVGTEYASTFQALGVPVSVIDGRDRLLSFLDGEMSRELERAMVSAGVAFHWKERVLRCEPRDDGVHLTLSSGRELVVSDVLVAAGRRSDTAPLALAAAGLAPLERGTLGVDERYRTSVPSIYAAGDVVGAPALASTGIEQARIAICHAFELLDKRPARILPTGIYSIPEAAMAGETEESLRAKDIEFVVGRALYAQNPRGRIIGEESGFLKLLFRRSDLRLLGVHVLGEQAIELVHVGLVAMECDAGAELFNTTCFNYPTLTDLYKLATYDALLTQRRETLGAAMPPVASVR